MNVAQETLGFRRACLSHALSLLMSAFALPIPPVGFSTHLHRPTERSPTASGIRGQESGIRSNLLLYLLWFLINPCSILAICSYSSRQRHHASSSMYFRSKQYRIHTRISSAEPIAIRMNRLNSAL